MNSSTTDLLQSKAWGVQTSKRTPPNPKPMLTTRGQDHQTLTISKCVLEKGHATATRAYFMFKKMQSQKVVKGGAAGEQALDTRAK